MAAWVQKFKLCAQLDIYSEKTSNHLKNILGCFASQVQVYPDPPMQFLFG